MIIEADEHMASFLNYWPKIIVLTNIEADHLDCYKDLPDIQSAFEKFISQIRRRIPKIALRTTVIVGFPGEGEAEFEELIGFIRRVKFNRLGGFTYQRENGTVASKMRGQLSERKKAERLKRLMRVQAGIARELNNKMIDQTMEILIERVVRGGFVGRSSADAPEIDGSVLVKSNKILKPGEFVRARITGAKAYDLFGSSA